ncbi:MAG: FkbM family methyltransferase [Verrucomicrobia bacterium]|nr:FkbM family methyltransferase [Verrucomicrobiota bacterium]
MQRDLIYDVGMHNGNDTAFYLHRGYRVVAIEADPTLVELARARFAAELAGGRLTLLNVGVATEEGRADFWICDGKSEYNSFDKANATKRGHTAHAIEIPCRRFDNILREHGVPHYLKIDIECFDKLCVEALDAADLPPYVSLEVMERGQIEALRRAGYDRFKLVRQDDLSAVPDLTGAASAGWLALKERVPPLMKLSQRLGRMKRKLGRWLRRTDRKTAVSGVKSGRWEFAYGSSGVFGEEAPGQWLGFDETVRRWQAFHRAAGERYWCDVHATRQAAAK